MTGRLTLSWANKDKALLSHGETGYEWVERNDPRAREVRLLDGVGSVGETVGDASDNLLIRGDSLDALRALVKTPEYAEQYRGKVKLVYIDPPFNTGQAFEHYDDSLEHSVWLGMMRERLLLIRELLSPDGSVWVHLDDAEMAYCRVLMDEIFGRQNFVATFVWETDAGRRNDTDISTVQDYVTCFAADRQTWRQSRNLLPRTADQERRYKNPDDDPRGPWLQGADSTARSGNDGLRYPITLPSGRTVVPPSGVYWRFSKENFDRAVSEGRVYFGADGNRMPIVKRYLSDVQDGVVPRTLWTAAEVGSNMTAKRDHIRKLFPEIAAFATPKPERLLERIIHIGSNPDDIVLDCFAGSGTTAAVAHKMGRRWVTVELNENTADTFTRPRLEKVVAGEDPGGVTENAGWQGGGGFRDLRVAASVWNVVSDDLGTAVFQADGVDPATLARSVAAQLGYTLIDHPVFVAAKGRSRLAVASGVVDPVAVADVVSHLGENETCVIAALSHTEDAATTLAELSRGSRVMRIPAQLFPALGKVTR